MSDKTAIEWTDATWNPIVGCSVISPGCTNCYAMKLAGTRLKHHPTRQGLTIETKAGPVWSGEVRLNATALDQPLRWKRPRKIFVCAHGDLFHEKVPDAWIDQVFAVMALAPQHTFQVLTKRAERMRRYMAESLGRIADAVQPLRTDDNRVVGPLPHIEPGARWWPLANVWLGVSTEDQARADERIPHLLATPAAKRFISAEPLLGAIDLNCVTFEGCDRFYPFEGYAETHPGGTIDCPRLDWVIAGGESGRGARPMHPDWARSLRDQCQAAGVPFFFKQWGEWAPQVGAVDGWTIDDDPEISRIDHRDWEGDHYGEPYRPMWCDDIDDDTVSRLGKKRAGALLDGREWREFPI